MADSTSTSRVYLVKQKPTGTVIEGPNRHAWDCKRDDYARCTAFAQALDRAYTEGQKSITQNLEIALVLEMIGRMTPVALADLSLSGCLQDLIDKAREAAKSLAAGREQNTRNRAFLP